MLNNMFKRRLLSRGYTTASSALEVGRILIKPKELGYEVFSSDL